MKTYVITLSRVFPKGHSEVGKETYFKEKLDITLKGYDCHVIEHPDGGTSVIKGRKIHTIRANYPLWAKRIAEIQQGKACLSIRQWTGKPYRSKQREIIKLTSDSIGIEPLIFLKGDLNYPSVYDRMLSRQILANNDGLSLTDWEDWFKGYDLSKELAIIHFTNFRYNRL